MSTARAGRLIALEGLDGAGTTTQAHRLVEAVNAAGRNGVFTCQPSRGPIGVLLRSMLAGEHALPHGDIDQRCFTLLFAADRLDHWSRTVAPALAQGAIVVSDRWTYSSLAYQATKVEPAWIAQANAHAATPDLLLFVRVRADVAAARRLAAGRSHELFDDLAMQREVEGQYETVMARAQAMGVRVEMIDGERPLDEVTAAIWRAVAPLLAAS